MKKRLTILLIALWISMATTACGATFKGKVIDAETKEPIEGAVVVATWLEETTGVAATHTRLKEVKEALTDSKGEWVIEGPRGREGDDITATFTFLTGIYYTKSLRLSFLSQDIALGHKDSILTRVRGK